MNHETEFKGKEAAPHAGGVAFRVWAPHAQQVSVIGSFNNWIGDRDPLQVEENGNWYANVADAHTDDQYRFLLDTEKGESSSDWQEYSEDFAGHPSADVVAEPGEYDGLPLHAALPTGPQTGCSKARRMTRRSEKDTL